jgi:hypothetical protein
VPGGSILAKANVKAAKERFDSGRKRKIPYSFEELLKLFEEDTISFSEIARRAGVKKQAVQKLYYRYFKNLFSGRTGVDRGVSATPKRRALKIEQAKQTFERVPWLKPVGRQARAAGLQVEAMPVARAPGTIYRERLLINGHVCSVHLLTKKRKTSPRNNRWFVHMSVSTTTLEEVEFVIARTAVKGYPSHTFVVPVSTLLDAHKGSGTPPGVNFWIPTKKEPTHNNRVDWWAHEEAWYLLM